MGKVHCPHYNPCFMVNYQRNVASKLELLIHLPFLNNILLEAHVDCIFYYYLLAFVKVLFKKVLGKIKFKFWHINKCCPAIKCIQIVQKLSSFYLWPTRLRISLHLKRPFKGIRSINMGSKSSAPFNLFRPTN
jgi:hypothetical protein